MPLTSQIGLTVGSTQTATQALGDAKATLNKSYAVAFTNGTSAGQADKIYIAQRTIVASGTDDLDLAGVLLDPLAGTITLARVKGLIVSAAAANTNDVVVGGAAATQFVAPFGSATDKVKVRPGATLALFSGAADTTGYVTAAGATDLLRIANGGAGTSVTYDIVIIGASV